MNVLRESLTILAILLILVLSAALAVPYFVDWNRERGLVEAQLSAVLGQPVKVRGAIDLKLLPTPYLRLADIEVGGGTSSSELKIDEIQLEIALPALLRGEVDFVEAKLLRPQLALAIPQEAAAFGTSRRLLAGRMRFERVVVEDGTLKLADRDTGRSYLFSHVSLDAEAESLAGPLKARGNLSYAGVRSAFTFAAGARESNRQSIRLIVDENTQHPRADLDANLIFPRAGAGGLPSIAGQLKLAGHTGGDFVLPWQLAGTLQAALHRAAIRDLDLRLGEEDHSIDFTGAADIDLGTNPRANATLKARQLDLDRLLAIKGGPSAMQRLTHAAAALIESHDLMAFRMPVAVSWSADAAVLGGESLGGLSGGFSVADKQAAWLRFEADGPGRLHVLLDGDIETGTAAGFKGRLEASAGEVPRLIHWLSTNLPEDKAFFRNVQIQSFDVASTINLSQIGFVGRDLSLRLDQSKLSGTLAYTASVGGEPARLFADLSASKVDLDAMPDLSILGTRAKAMDLSLRLDAAAVKVGGFGQGGVATGRIAVQLEKIGALTKLAAFTVKGLGGADISAQGQWDGKSGMLAGSLDSRQLGPAGAMLHRLMPGPTSDALAALAESLSPAHLTFSAQAERTAKGGLALKALTLSGRAANTKIVANIGADPHDPAALLVAATVTAPDATALMRQVGFSALPLERLGAGEITAKGRGGLDKPFAIDLSATLAASHMTFHGSVSGDLATPHAAGALHLESSNLTPLLEATGLAFPDPTLRLATDLSADVDARSSVFTLRDLAGRFAGVQVGGSLQYDAKQRHLTGALTADELSLSELAAMALGEPAPPVPGTVWSSAKFQAAMIDPPPTDLSFTAKSLALAPRLSGAEARFDLQLSGGREGLKLALQHVSMQIGQGRAAGDFTLHRDGAAASLAGHLKLSDYDLDLPEIQGKLSGDLDLAGTGNSIAAIVAGLAGSGALKFNDLRLPKTDPAAMGRVFKAVEEHSLSLDGSEIDRALGKELDKAASAVGGAAFDMSLAAGVLRFSPVGAMIKLPAGVAETLQGSLDLNDLALAQSTGLSLLALPRNWSGPPPQITLSAKGPFTSPARSIDSASFVNALAARAIARESARIQAQEFDLHEQAFFYNRLKSERRREEERRAAEAAKRAEIAAEQRRKAEEAARAAMPMPIFRPQQRPATPMAARPAARPRAPTDPLAVGRY